MAEGPDSRGIDYLLLGHVTVDRLDDKRTAATHTTAQFDQTF